MYQLYCDGGCKPTNPGSLMTMGCILRQNNIIIDTLALKIDDDASTCNKAEYLSLIQGLELCLTNNIDIVQVYMDSNLVIHQMQKKWQVKSDSLKFLFLCAQGLSQKFRSISYKWIPRTLNTHADALT